MLRSTSYRSVKVIDIAREAGTSPATFYQYFADVEAAILVLAQEMALDGERLVHLVADGNWKGKAGYQTSLDLTDAFFAFWDQHRPVLRVVDLSTDEGDRRFRNIRVTPAQRRDHRARQGHQRAPGRGQEPRASSRWPRRA